MKLRDLLKQGEEKLEASGIPNAAYDARLLLQEAYGKDAAELLRELDRPMCPGATGGTEPAEITACPGDCGGKLTFEASISQRARHIPLQQILGYTWFMGLRMIVNRHVLIPRQDTEILAETVLNREQEKDIRLLDLCTGSGCLAVSLKKLGDYSYVEASDAYRDALHVAMRNASEQKTEIHFTESDLFDRLTGPYDVIVSNPPYIASGEIAGLAPEVRDHDPLEALDGGADGLTFYRRIAAECPAFLKPGGRIYLEIGYDQAEAVRSLLEEAGFEQLTVIQDLAGLDRVVCGTRRSD